MCTTWGMGTIAPVTKETKARMEGLGLTQEKVARPLLEAVEALQEYSGIKAGALIAFEIGGLKTPGPIDAA